MRLVLLAIQMLIFLCPAGAEDPLSRYFSPDDLGMLRAGKVLSAGLPADYTLRLLPAVASSDSIAAEVRERKPTIGVEMSSIISGLPQQMDTREGWLLLYNSLHAVSTMKGISYYSVSRGSTHVLFSESYAIDSAEGKNRVADPVFAEIPPENHVFTFQQDDWFGKNFYEEHFLFKEDHLLITMDNLTTIMFMFVPVIQPRNLASQVALIPCGNDVVFYGVSYLTTSFPLGDRHSREESLKNRLTAMADWLKARLSGEPQ